MDGGFGTSAYTDPVEGVIGILFTHRMMDSPEPPKVLTDFWTMAYGAMEYMRDGFTRGTAPEA